MDTVQTQIKNRRLAVYITCYLIFLGIFTLNPFAFSIYWLKRVVAHNLIQHVFIDIDPFDMFRNVLLFMPFGVMLYFVGSVKKTKFPWIWIVFCGAFLSGVIEFSQLFLTRATSIYDIITNTAGTYIGFRMTPLLIQWKESIQKKSGFFKSVIPRWIVISLWYILIVIVFTHGLRINTLKYWNPQYTFLFGNEVTLNRPWQGKLYSLAIYKKALRPSDIHKLYLTHLQDDTLRKQSTLVAFYHMTEGKGDTLFDSIGQMHIHSSNIQWQEEDGIYLDGQDVPEATNAESLCRTLQSVNQFSVELWMQTDNLEQTGPARIISFSKNVNKRNFTIGQSEKELAFRVNTPVTGPNGSWVCLHSEPVLQKNKKHHIVFTFHHGLQRLYVDGVPKKPVVRTDAYLLPRLFGLGRITLAHPAIYILCFLPFSILMHGLFRKFAFCQTVFYTTLSMGLIQIVFWITLAQPVGSMAILYTTLVAMPGGLAGSLLHQKK